MESSFPRLCNFVCVLYNTYVKQRIHNATLYLFSLLWLGSKCMVMSRDQIAGRSNNIKTDNCSFERVEDFKYLGTALTNQNSVQEEIKSRLKKGNACYHSVQNLLSSCLLSKNLNIKIYGTVILPVVLYGYEERSVSWLNSFRRYEGR